MNDLLLDAPPNDASTTRRSKLVLHCGARAVSIEQVSSVPTPLATTSWQPIPHDRLIESVTTTLKATNLNIRTQAHSLSPAGMRYFGLMVAGAVKFARKHTRFINRAARAGHLV